MAKYNNQKAKILFLQQMLYETGENRTISMQEILDRLQEMGIRAERKSIYDDLEVLRYFGMDVRYKRERPSGYYLAGVSHEIHVEKVSASVEAVPGPKPAFDAEPAPVLDGGSGSGTEVAQETGMEEAAEASMEPDHKSWMKMDKDADKKKQMKLLCQEQALKEVRRFFRGTESVKEHIYGEYIVTVPLLEDPRFFGWLTAMGSDVHLQKPKKTVQAYRDYLKFVARDYKSEK